MTLPAEAVEAAARALVPGDWKLVPERSMGHYRREATAALMAALPFLREAIRAELLQELIARAERDSADERPIVGHITAVWLRGVVDLGEGRKTDGAATGDPDRNDLPG